MQVGLHRFHADSVEWLRTAVADGGRTRRQLAQELCERENWRNGKGELCLASARRVLPKLAGKLGIALPPPRDRLPQKAPTRDFPDLSLRCSLAEVGEVALEPVSGSADRERWRSMMETHHPQRWTRPPGAQRCYWIASSRHGRLGGIAFCAAGWHQKARDEFVGWSADARVANLQGQQQPVSPVAGGARARARVARSRPRGDAATRRLGSRLRRAAGLHLRLSRPVLAIVRRAGSVAAGQRQGCRRAPRRGASRGRSKPLAADWKERMCRKPERMLGLAPKAPPSDDWAEYGRGT